MRSRLTYGCYRELGITDAVASERADSAALAVAIANEPDRQRALRRSIAGALPRLHHRPASVAGLGELLAEAHRRGRPE